MTVGAHAVFSPIIARRSPLLNLETDTLSALPPEWARVVVPMEHVFLPVPEDCQQTGKPDPCSKPGLTPRLTPAEALVLATATIGRARVAAPRAARTALLSPHFLHTLPAPLQR